MLSHGNLTSNRGWKRTRPTAEQATSSLPRFFFRGARYRQTARASVLCRFLTGLHLVRPFIRMLPRIFRKPSPPSSCGAARLRKIPPGNRALPRLRAHKHTIEMAESRGETQRRNQPVRDNRSSISWKLPTASCFQSQQAFWRSSRPTTPVAAPLGQDPGGLVWFMGRSHLRVATALRRLLLSLRQSQQGFQHRARWAKNRERSRSGSRKRRNPAQGPSIQRLLEPAPGDKNPFNRDCWVMTVTSAAPRWPTDFVYTSPTRKKDLIKTSGEVQSPPQPIENAPETNALIALPR